MKLKCKNIGKLSSAEVDINTITLIAGLNGTGKSTVGKLLYCIFNSLFNLEKTAKEKLRSVIRRYLSDNDFIFELSIEKLDNCISSLFNIRNKADITSVKEIILSYMGQNYIKNKKESFFNDITELLNISDDIIYTSLLQNKLIQEFDGQIQNIYINNNSSSIDLIIDNKDIKVNIENNEVISIENMINLKTEVIYIDDPFVLDNLNRRPISSLGHKSDLIKKLRRQINADNDLEKVIEEIIRTKKIDNLYEKLDTVCNGNIVLNPKEGFDFQIDSSKDKLKLVNISTGLKALVIIKTLLLNDSLEKKGTLVLDEPEIHLHPEWQKLLAEIIVLIQKEFDMHILINSHSPYFIKAIDVYAKKYKIRKTCKFYLAKDDESHKTAQLKDVSDNLEEIYKLLFITLQELEDERSEIESENSDD